MEWVKNKLTSFGLWRGNSQRIPEGELHNLPNTSSGSKRTLLQQQTYSYSRSNVNTLPASSRTVNVESLSPITEEDGRLPNKRQRIDNMSNMASNMTLDLSPVVPPPARSRLQRQQASVRLNTLSPAKSVFERSAENMISDSINRSCSNSNSVAPFVPRFSFNPEQYGSHASRTLPPLLTGSRTLPTSGSKRPASTTLFGPGPKSIKVVPRRRYTNKRSSSTASALLNTWKNMSNPMSDVPRIQGFLTKPADAFPSKASPSPVQLAEIETPEQQDTSVDEDFVFDDAICLTSQQFDVSDVYFPSKLDSPIFLDKEDVWTCQVCIQSNRSSNDKCCGCGSKRIMPLQPNEWLCSICMAVNTKPAQICKSCKVFNSKLANGEKSKKQNKGYSADIMEDDTPTQPDVTTQSSDSPSVSNTSLTQSQSEKLRELIGEPCQPWMCSRCLQQNNRTNCVYCPRPKVDTSSLRCGSRRERQQTWHCNKCLTDNTFLDDYCKLCNTMRQGAPPPPSAYQRTFKIEEQPPKPTVAPPVNAPIQPLVASSVQLEQPKPAFTFSLPSSGSNTTTVDAAKPSSNSWGDAFKQKNDEWSCPTCMIRNKNDINKCVSCDTSKPGVVVAKPEVKPSLVQQPAPATSSAPSLAEMFKQKADEWKCPTCMISNKVSDAHCVACKEANPKAPQPVAAVKPAFKFGFSNAVSTAPDKPIEVVEETPKASAAKKIGFNFGGEGTASAAAPTPTFNFGTVKPEQPVVANSSDEVVKPFSLPQTATSSEQQKPTFSFGAGQQNNNNVSFKFGESASSQQPKPTFTFGQSAKTSDAPVAATAPFTFGQASSVTNSNEPPAAAAPFSFGQSATSSATSGGFKFGETSKPSTGFSFGKPTASTEQASAFSAPKTTATTSTFGQPSVFGNGGSGTASGGFGFGSATGTAPSSGFGASVAQKKPFSFGGSNDASKSTGFSFGGFSNDKPADKWPSVGNMANKPQQSSTVWPSVGNLDNKPQQAAPSQSIFGGSSAFGGAPAQSTTTPFQFGATNDKPPAEKLSFNFGNSAQQPVNGGSGFNFGGAQQEGGMQFGSGTASNSPFGAPMSGDGSAAGGPRLFAPGSTGRRFVQAKRRGRR